MKSSPGRFLGALFAAGISSALVSSAAWNLPIELDAIPFAIAITAVFAAFGRITSLPRGAALLALSALAFPAALRLAGIIWTNLANLPPSSHWWALRSLTGAVALCGYFGLLITSIGASFAAGQGLRGLRRALAWSPAGALWGLLAGVAMRNRIDALGLGFLIWQPLAALTLGLIVAPRRADRRQGRAACMLA